MTAHGVRRGHVVSVQLPNWWEAIVASWAVWRLGAVLNPITPIYRGSELRTIFAMAKPALVLTPGEFGSTDYLGMTSTALRDSQVDAAVCAIRPERSDGEVLGAGSQQGIELPQLDTLSVDDVSVLMFTSGTTGRPKGVLHSQRTLLYEAWSIAERFALHEPVVFMPSPLTHITGLLYGILLPVLTRGSVVLQDRWETERAVDIVEGEGCTFCVGATPFLSGLVEEYRRRGITSTLGGFVCGGADVPPAVIEEADRVMGTTAVRAYGLTELPTLTCGLPDEPIARRCADDGLLIGSSQARLVNLVDGVGELEARGPEMFLGYLDPRDNDAAFTKDGWFRTGDLAAMDGNRVRIAGRSKDIIVRGGENLSPIEVENIIRDMEFVTDVAVVGVPDVVLGERACAIVVVDGPPPTLEEIRAFLDTRQLARQKAPEHLLVTPSLPRTPSGKVQKYVLRDWAAQRLASGEGESR
jgi:cyclohexanecarboxylate-CoA ligase